MQAFSSVPLGRLEDPKIKAKTAPQLQQVHLPSDPLQPGPIYFLSRETVVYLGSAVSGSLNSEFLY